MSRWPGLILLMTWISVVLTPTPATARDEAQEALIATGARLFFTATFNGNGRTCATCHRRERSFALDPAFIVTLPATDPLFVTDALPALRDPANPSRDLEDTALLKARGLIRVRVDGFDRPAVLRAPPSLQNLALTAPFGGQGSFTNLRDFIQEAIRQHFPQTLQRVEGRDFRLATAEELTALEAFLRSLRLPPEGQEVLEHLVTTPAQHRGQALFFGAQAKCAQCHGGPSLSAASLALGGGNRAFNTGVIDLEKNAALRAAEAGRAFSTPSLLGIRHSAPFFHNNSFATLRDAVTFYNSPEFNASPAAVQVGTITLASDQIDDLVAFLEVLTCPHDGDVNQDRQHTPGDALLVLQHFFNPAAGLLTTCQQERGDVLAPGSGLTPADALCIFQQALGLPSCFAALADTVPTQLTAQVCGSGRCTSPVGTPLTLEAQLRNDTGDGVGQVAVAFQLGPDTLGTVTTDRTGRATRAFTPMTPGVFVVRVQAQGLEAVLTINAEGNADGNTKVIPQPCDCDVEVGETVDIGISLTNAAGGSVAGIEVVYRLRLANGTLQELARGRTNSQGEFTFIFIPPGPGVFVVIATVLGVEVPFYVVVRERPNQPPTVLTPLADITVAEDAAPRVLDLREVFTDPDSATRSEQLTFTLVSNTNPTLVTATLTGTQLVLVFGANQHGKATLTLRATDAAEASVETSVGLTVTPVNDPPRVLQTIRPVTVLANSETVPLDLSEIFLDPDAFTDGDRLRLTVENTTPELLSAIPVGSGALLLELHEHEFGSAHITIHATDRQGARTQTTVAVAVRAGFSRQRFPAGAGPGAVAVADVDGDGHLSTSSPPIGAPPTWRCYGAAATARLSDNSRRSASLTLT
ncbi:MAG: hypothetical protein FJZ47_00590 [Candidatus Tectomicrobia bacterium]|uniref:Cytochrome c domain-containing protein n=1 Tax=Tectimicrobiota bacterium TaxID=2528274 RepID=A0A937VY39_UNCTE|nr:hypothetical protein [Candidatus Tectomicrobia bacterium]